MKKRMYIVTLSGILSGTLNFDWMMGVASEKQVAWTCVGYIVVGVFDKGLHLGRVQDKRDNPRFNET